MNDSETRESSNNSYIGRFQRDQKKEAMNTTKLFIIALRNIES